MPRYESSTPTALFIYGTLLAPEVMKSVVGMAYATQPAVLPGYRAWVIRGEVFPGIVPGLGSGVEGALIEGLDPETLAKLDTYEGELYEQRKVKVRLPDTGEERDVHTYVVRSGYRHLLTTQPWDLETFRTKHLNVYLGLEEPEEGPSWIDLNPRDPKETYDPFADDEVDPEDPKETYDPFADDED